MYHSKCAITGTCQKDVLDAAHIQPYLNEKSNHIQNGICLRSDIHRLFDNGLLSIDKNFNVEVSAKLKDEQYKWLHASTIFLPEDYKNRPSQIALQFHRERIFRSDL